MKRSLFLAAAAAFTTLAVAQPANAALILSPTPTATGFTATFGNQAVANGAFSNSVKFTVGKSGILNGTFSTFGDPFGGVNMSVPGASVTITPSKAGSAVSFILAPNPVFTAGGLGNTLIKAGEYTLSVTGSNSFGVSSYSGTLNFFAVPEPATWAMMIGGFGLIGAATRRARKLNVTYA